MPEKLVEEERSVLLLELIKKTRRLDDKRHMTTNGEICKIFMVGKFL